MTYTTEKRPDGHLQFELVQTEAYKVLFSSESNEWYTPSSIIEAARKVMGPIDLDPASCEQANEWIGAKQFHSLSDDGFNKDWKAKTLWLNPPYGQKNRKKGIHGASAWLLKAIESFRARDVGQAILLCRGDSASVKWLEKNAICCVANRIAFVSPTDPEANNPVPGTKIFYLGTLNRWGVFAKEFEQHGSIVAPYFALKSTEIFAA